MGKIGPQQPSSRAVDYELPEEEAVPDLSPVMCRLDEFTKVVLRAKGKGEDARSFRLLREALENTGYAGMKLSQQELEHIARQVHIGSGMVRMARVARLAISDRGCGPCRSTVTFGSPTALR